MTHRPRAALATCSILAIAAVASACSGSDTAAEPDAPETVVVGMSWPYEPWQVGDGSGTKEGVEPEILAAIGEKQNPSLSCRTSTSAASSPAPSRASTIWPCPPSASTATG